ncbi:MAG TPA: non-homologous end-joining DNA ligase [Chryseolinea sp.]
MAKSKPTRKRQVRPKSSRGTEKVSPEKKRKENNDPEDAKLLSVDGHQVKLTNQQKIYWPKEGFTKGDVLNYYNSISKFILPYLKDRPQSLKRNPNGIADKGFFHKDAGDKAPSWVDHAQLYSESAEKNIDYIVCNNRATLLYLNNLGCIEINPWNSRLKKLDHPDYLVMDIDPADTSSFEEVIETALVIKNILDKAQAPSYCKTSGATGLHIYVPVHAAYHYDQVRAFAEIIATLTQEQLPATTTTERALNKRKGRIYIDYLQNKRGQTLASVYSLRPVPAASISTPLTWKEVKPGLLPAQFNIRTMMKRMDKVGDLFQGVLKEKLNLKKALKNLAI